MLTIFLHWLSVFHFYIVLSNRFKLQTIRNYFQKNVFDLFYTNMIMKKIWIIFFWGNTTFKLTFFVILTKCSFMTLAIYFSSVRIVSFSSSIIFVKLEPLSLKYGWTFFQNSLLSATSLTFNLAKYCFFVFFNRSIEKIRWCFYFC